MTDARLVRSEKLLALRERELDAAKNNLALAVTATLHAKEAADQGEREWLEAVDKPATDLATLADHEDFHQQLHLLRAAAERLARAFEEAVKRENSVRQAVTHATKEAKKWSFGTNRSLNRSTKMNVAKTSK